MMIALNEDHNQSKAMEKGGRSAILNMSTGPVEVSSAVLDAQLEPMLTPHHPSFWELHDQTIGLLQMTLRTTGKVLMMHGSIRTGIDLALGNFVGPGSRVLAVQNGFWGALIAEWAALRGAEVVTVDHGPLEQLDLERIERLLQQSHFDLVTVVHVETNAGIVNPIEKLGQIVERTDALYFVDTACSAGAIPVETDRWKIDIGTTGSHKCLASVPGIAVITLSDKAWSRIRSQDMGAYFNFRRLWAATIDRQSLPPFTQPSSLVRALRQALLEIAPEEIEGWWKHHADVASDFMSRARQAGFGFLLDESDIPHPRTSYADSVMAISYPAGVSDDVFRNTLFDKFGIFVIGNVGVYAGRSFRVGLMSPSQLDPKNVDALLQAMSAARDLARSA